MQIGHHAQPSTFQDFVDLGGKHLLYFGDPMCSWCWGFSPVLDEVVKSLNDNVTVHTIVTGLRTDTSQAWDEELRSYIRHHWINVQDRTGQPFDFSRFEDSKFVYNTEPACRAVVSARQLMPHVDFDFFKALQVRFYAHGQGIYEPEHFDAIAQNLGFLPDTYHAMFEDPDTRNRTQLDFALTREFGVAGYPSVVLLDGGDVTFLTQGYQSFESLRPRLEEWLNG